MTFSYIPVLIAGCVLGPKESLITGMVFGLASMWKASAFYVGAGDAIFSPVMSGNPAASIMMSVVARALFGLVPGFYIRRQKEAVFPKTGIVLVSTAGRSIHTLFVYLFMGFFFPEMGYTAADTVQEVSEPEYLRFIVILDCLVLLCYLFVNSRYMREFMAHIRSVDQMNVRRWRMNILLILMIAAAFSVAVYLPTGSGGVMANYGFTLSEEMAYDIMHLQLQFLMGGISCGNGDRHSIMSQKNALYLHYEARLDDLTGLYGRQQFFQRGEELLRRMEFGENRIGGCFIILDVDYFKRIHDQYGHPAGDKVLKAVAAGMKAACESYGILGRLGGDEFVALLCEPLSKEEIEEILG